MFYVEQDDYLSQMVEAIYRGDLTAAETALERYKEKKGHPEWIRNAKMRARPELRHESRLPKPDVRPWPGHKPGFCEPSRSIKLERAE
ncbi:MAG: hypothetical protein AAF692_13240 [Pseudomonadota bacterium]